MKPVQFEECNVVYGKDQPQFGDLPAYEDAGPQGYVITCWQLSWKERLRLLLTGRVWLSSQTNRISFNAVQLTTRKDDLLQRKPLTKSLGDD